MGKVRENRKEKRLRYRWHARFTSNPKQKPLSGQMVDISSKGMALLYHADENCPKPDQFITTNFGVPYFDSEDSFDTVFFNRIGRVCRIDKLTSKVNRIAVQFAEPLFFKPGEQKISDSDVKQRLEAKAQLIVSGKEKTVAKAPAKVKEDNKTKSTAEETQRAYSEALARAEERIRSYAEAKAQVEEKLKSEIEARHTNETKLLAEAQEKIRIYAEAKARAEEKAKAEAKARTKAEAKAKTEARLRAKAEKKAESEAEKRAKIEADFRVKAESKPKAQKKKTTRKKDTSDKAKPSGEGALMDKVDKFITDRNRIF
jgi:hypothetical protein